MTSKLETTNKYEYKEKQIFTAKVSLFSFVVNALLQRTTIAANFKIYSLTNNYIPLAHRCSFGIELIVLW